jgi:hypothetical protein
MKKLEKYRAFEKWLMRETNGDSEAMYSLLYSELMANNHIVFNWLDEKAGNLKTNLEKISKLIIKRNK